MIFEKFKNNFKFFVKINHYNDRPLFFRSNKNTETIITTISTKPAPNTTPRKHGVVIGVPINSDEGVGIEVFGVKGFVLAGEVFEEIDEAGEEVGQLRVTG